MSDIPSVADFLKAEAEAEIADELAGEQAITRGYAIRPLNPLFPSIRVLAKAREAVRGVHRPPHHWDVVVRLGRDPRKYTFSCAAARDAEFLGKQFLKQLGEYIDDEQSDKLWNAFVLNAARKVDVRLRKVGGIDPPEDPILGPQVCTCGHTGEQHFHVGAGECKICDFDRKDPAAPRCLRWTEDHEHEWHWTGSWTNARPFPVWHMRCACGCWALLANRWSEESGVWLGYDEAVHDIRNRDGSPTSTSALPSS